MIEVIQSFDVKAWLLAGGLGLILTSLVTICVMLIKQRINAKSDIMQRKVLNESTMATLVSLGTDIKTILTAVTPVTDSIQQIIALIQTAAESNTTTGTNLASFVLECFNESNLSDEKKQKLKLLFEKTFFSNNEQLIEALKSAKANSEDAVVAANKVIAELQRTVQEKDQQLLSAQTTRKSRRA